MKITEKTIDYVAALAKLTLSEEEKKAARKDLEEILSYMEVINQLDTKEEKPLSHPLEIQNVFRQDVIEESQEDILLNAPEKKDGCFVAPKTIE